MIKIINIFLDALNVHDRFFSYFGIVNKFFCYLGKKLILKLSNIRKNMHKGKFNSLLKISL